MNKNRTDIQKDGLAIEGFLFKTLTGERFTNDSTLPAGQAIITLFQVTLNAGIIRQQDKNEIFC